MSLDVKKVLTFPQGGIEYIPPFDNETISTANSKLLGGILHDTRHVWHAKGPVLEVRNTKTGSKVGAWIFGGILKDSNTTITCVEEVLRPNGRISLLAIGIECTISGGIICIFDIFSSKVLRAIQIKEKITYLHVIDPGIEVSNLPGPLRNFDGILAAGLDGGDIILVDICKQTCEESLHSILKRDELNPSQLIILTLKHIPKIEHYKEKCVREGNHLAIHLNAVFNSTTEHFVLKGPKDDDRIYVNREEVETSALYYCPQLTSLLVGYNFGAFQLWDLTTLRLVYTSPVCEEHFPITSFALQEPTDDPRAFCYVWVAFGNTALYQSGFPYAVMYSLCYESKEYQEGYGYLYQDFHYCTIRFQVQLGQLEDHRGEANAKGGYCLGFQPITKLSTSKESFSHSPAGDTLALCLISWTVWFSKSDTQTCCLIFDLNQWYKEQMPSVANWEGSTNYILRANVTEMIHLGGNRITDILKVLMDDKSLTQFMGVQRLEEHFYPTSLSFNLWALRETDVVLMHNQGVQKYLLSQIETAGPLCLVRPNDVCRQVIAVGLIPLFVDIHPNRSLSTEIQREIILNVALEHQLTGWLCKCASEWANGSFSSAGCSLEFIINWAYERADVLKNNCDQYCVPLFDYSQLRLDSNANVLLNSCTRQINNLCVLYKHIVNKLSTFVACLNSVSEHLTGLEMVSVYFEVLQWLVNVGLLPECHPSAYPRPDNSERISAPYFAKELTEYYNERRAELQLLTKETFGNTDSLLFIDNLIEKKCGGQHLLSIWYEDKGTGAYPPPSLQSLIRTYLVPGAGINYKHSLVIYLFLDLAMALDQTWYSSVVTHLIKFPAVFKVSPSIIKITQAFWQLDHGDFTTAMEQLLDPFVLGEDLQPWHHNIAMRSLLVHKQPNFALLYMQIRKPPITDENDVLTAISLFIANNMLDEAFYFKKQHQNKNEEKLLAHLFHECSKNDALHLILYKCLNTDEEKAFFDYLKRVKNPTSDDLQIFYYLLRSRFIEAFDTHSKLRRKYPENEGLIGQSMASKTDQIVKIFKTLLPDVNKNLVEYIRREKTNLWREVQRPTPMSVFVHDTSEQVQYKSTLIHAALAKAKQTFPEIIDRSNFRDLTTEETPFLRTPTICRTGKRAVTPVITPKMIYMDENADELSPPPSKRMRISPRARITSPQSPIKRANIPFTLTPIVKRKASLERDKSWSRDNLNVCTPQSILKVRHLVTRRDSITSENLMDDDKLSENQDDQLLQNTNLHLEGRNSLLRTPKRQHVQFEEACFSDQSKLESTPIEDIINFRSSASSKDISSLLSSSVNEENSDDVFYSPNNSLNIEDEVDEVVKIKSIHTAIVEREADDENQKTVKEKKIEIEVPEEIDVNVVKEISTPEIKISVASPRARRSYKRSIELTPTRSSPRLSKLQVAEEKEPTSQSKLEGEVKDDIPPTEFLSPKLTRPKGRKSLTRQVLENNTFSKIYTPPLKENIISEERSYFKSERSSITEKSLVESKTTTVETNISVVECEEKDTPLKGTYKTRTSSSSFTKKENLEKVLDSESSIDSDVSYQYEEQEPSMKLSDSLQEYIDFLMASGKKLGDNEQFKDKSELSKTKLKFEKDKELITEDEEITSDGETEQFKDTSDVRGTQFNFQKDDREMTTEDDDISSDEDVIDSRVRMPEIRQSEDVSTLSKSHLNLEKHDNPLEMEEISSDGEIEEKPEPSEEITYQELRALNENTYDFEQKDSDVLPSSSTCVTVQRKVYQELSSGASENSNEQEHTFNELETNIFGLSGYEADMYSGSRRSNVFSGDAVEVASKPEDEIVLISSDSENGRDSTSRQSYNSVNSKSNDNCDESEDNDKDSNSHRSYNSVYSKSTENCGQSDENSNNSLENSDASQNTDRSHINVHYEEQDNDFEEQEDNEEEDQVIPDDLNIVQEILESDHSEETCSENVDKQNIQSYVTEAIDITDTGHVEKPANITLMVDPLSTYVSENLEEKEETGSTETNLLQKMETYPTAFREDGSTDKSSNRDQIPVIEISSALEKASETEETVQKDKLIDKEDDQSSKEQSKSEKITQKVNLILDSGKSKDKLTETITEENDPTQINQPITEESLEKDELNTTCVVENTEGLKKKEEIIDQSTDTTLLEKDQKKKVPDEDIKSSVDQDNLVTDTVSVEPNLFGDVESEFPDNTVDDQPPCFSDIAEGKTPSKRVTRRNSSIDIDLPIVSSNTREAKQLIKKVKRRDRVSSKEFETIDSPANLPSKDETKSNASIDIDMANANSTVEGRQLIGDVKTIYAFSKKFGNISTLADLSCPARRTRRSLSASETSSTLFTPPKPDNVSIDCDNTASPKLIDNANLVKLTLRKKRSASVDVKMVSKPRTTRTKSVDSSSDVDHERKAKSVILMPIISEDETGAKKVKETRKTKSVVDSYTTARRLTRRQASMVKERTITTDVESEGIKRELQINLEPIDPIILLDKDHFEGKPDPDEIKVYESSSPSASTISVPSLKLQDTPKKRSRTRSRTGSPSASVVSTRSRRLSGSSSVVSEQSESSTPPKKGKKKNTEETETPARRTRSRTGSISSVKSDGSSKRKVAKARRTVAAKSKLPEIAEEKESVNKK